MIAENSISTLQWPSIGRNLPAGKESIEVRHVMGHTSGLAGFDAALKLRTSLIGSLRRVPRGAGSVVGVGTTSGYHLVTQGYCSANSFVALRVRRSLSSLSPR